MKTLKTLKRDMLADAATRAEYDAITDEFAIARELIAIAMQPPLNAAISLGDNDG